MILLDTSSSIGVTEVRNTKVRETSLILYIASVNAYNIIYASVSYTGPSSFPSIERVWYMWILGRNVTGVCVRKNIAYPCDVVKSLYC